MKVFLRDVDTGLFLRRPSGWVESLFEATDFREIEHAQEYATTCQKPNLEVFLTSDDRQILGGFRVERERDGH